MSVTSRRQCLVTGASRGLGLEFVRQLVANGDYVLGACRSPDSAGDLQTALEHGKWQGRAT
jgi:NAD(P)-dependent dehydrogenase (short-subunit alcohol dehydrogenase family)